MCAVVCASARASIVGAVIATISSDQSQSRLTEPGQKIADKARKLHRKSPISGEGACAEPWELVRVDRLPKGEGGAGRSHSASDTRVRFTSKLPAKLGTAMKPTRNTAPGVVISVPRNRIQASSRVMPKTSQPVRSADALHPAASRTIVARAPTLPAINATIIIKMPGPIKTPTTPQRADKTSHTAATARYRTFFSVQTLVAKFVSSHTVLFDCMCFDGGRRSPYGVCCAHPNRELDPAVRARLCHYR